jgi:hypothetical protein
VRGAGAGEASLDAGLDWAGVAAPLLGDDRRPRRRGVAEGVAGDLLRGVALVRAGERARERAGDAVAAEAAVRLGEGDAVRVFLAEGGMADASGTDVTTVALPSVLANL